MLKHKWNTKQDKKISRNPVRILIFITRHRRQFSCKSEDRSQTRLFAYRYEWFRKKKKRKEIRETAILQYTNKETKGIWLRRNLINDSDQMGTNDQRGDRLGTIPFRSRLPGPIIRPNDRLVDFRARRTRSARLDDWTESFERILGFRILYFGISACQLVNTLSTNNQQRINFHG